MKHLIRFTVGLTVPVILTVVATAIHRFTKLDWLMSVFATVFFVGGCVVVYGFGVLILVGKTWRGIKF